MFMIFEENYRIFKDLLASGASLFERLENLGKALRSSNHPNYCICQATVYFELSSPVRNRRFCQPNVLHFPSNWRFASFFCIVYFPDSESDQSSDSVDSGSGFCQSNFEGNATGVYNWECNERKSLKDIDVGDAFLHMLWGYRRKQQIRGYVSKYKQIEIQIQIEREIEIEVQIPTHTQSARPFNSLGLPTTSQPRNLATSHLCYLSPYRFSVTWLYTHTN